MKSLNHYALLTKAIALTTLTTASLFSYANPSSVVTGVAVHSKQIMEKVQVRTSLESIGTASLQAQDSAKEALVGVGSSVQEGAQQARDALEAVGDFMLKLKKKPEPPAADPQSARIR